tara:strand:- start:12 stop:248 length:237 start_codon:yes stop_codon:yes gene_type:complete
MVPILPNHSLNKLFISIPKTPLKIDGFVIKPNKIDIHKTKNIEEYMNLLFEKIYLSKNNLNPIKNNVNGNMNEEIPNQ